jgi:hypothetical protein
MRLLFLFLLLSNLGQAQPDTIFIIYPKNPILLDKNTNDTIIVNSPFEGVLLYETTLLPNTSNQVGLYGAGLFLNKVSGSPCKMDYDPRESTGNIINSVLITDSSWYFDLTIIANCCHYFLGDASHIEDSILNLIYHAYGGSYCACNCCFGLQYYFNSEDYMEDYGTIRYVMINNRRETILPLPQYSKKQK